MTKLLNSPVVDLAMKARAVAHWFEDFNRAADEAEVILDAEPEQAYTASQMATARLEAWNDGFLAASRGHASAHSNVNQRLFHNLLSQAESLDQKLESTAEHNATLITHWLARNVMAALPELSAAAMAERTRLVAELLRSSLRSRSKIEVRAGGKSVMICETMQDLCDQIAQHALADHADSEIVIAWDQGEARIDIEQTWDRIKAAILPLAGDTQPPDTMKPRECLSNVG